MSISDEKIYEIGVGFVDITYRIVLYCIVLYCIVLYCIVLYCYYISFRLKICCDTSPKYRCRYCFIYDFDCLSFNDILSVFTNGRIFNVPFLEINVNVIIMNNLVFFFST